MNAVVSSENGEALFWQVSQSDVGGAACRNRTDDLFITSESLCRLS
jgi:hypothetical protein